MKSINKLADYNDSKSLANRFRNGSFNFFEEKLKQTELNSLKILDVGGTKSFWVNRVVSSKK